MSNTQSDSHVELDLSLTEKGLGQFLNDPTVASGPGLLDSPAISGDPVSSGISNSMLGDAAPKTYAPVSLLNNSAVNFAETALADDGNKQHGFGSLADSSFSGLFALQQQVAQTDTTPATTPTDNGGGPVNNAPVLAAPAWSINEQQPAGTLIGTAAATDADGDTLTYGIAPGGDAALVTIDSATGAITTNGPLDAATKPNINLTITVSDGNGGTDTRAVVIPVNALPNGATLGGINGTSINTLDATDVRPFAAATVTNADPARTVTATVTLDNAAKGVLSGAGIVAQGGGVYTVSGTAAAVEAALRAAVYNPTDNRLNALSLVDTTTFTVSVTDSSAPGVSATMAVNATQAQGYNANDTYNLPFNIAEGSLDGVNGATDTVNLQSGVNRFDGNTHLPGPGIVGNIAQINGTGAVDTLTLDGTSKMAATDWPTAVTDPMLGVNLGGGNDTLNLKGDHMLYLQGVEHVLSLVGDTGIKDIALDASYNGQTIDIHLNANAQNTVTTMAGVNALNIHDGAGISNLGADSILTVNFDTSITNAMNMQGHGGATIIANLHGGTEVLGTLSDVQSVTLSAGDDNLTVGAVTGYQTAFAGNGGHDTLTVNGAANIVAHSFYSVDLNGNSTVTVDDVAVVTSSDNNNQTVHVTNFYANTRLDCYLGGGNSDRLIVDDMGVGNFIYMTVAGVEYLQQGANGAKHSASIMMGGATDPMYVTGFQGAHDSLTLYYAGNYDLRQLNGIERLDVAQNGSQTIQIGSMETATGDAGAGALGDGINIGNWGANIEFTSNIGPSTVDIWTGAGNDVIAPYAQGAAVSLHIHNFNDSQDAIDLKQFWGQSVLDGMLATWDGSSGALTDGNGHWMSVNTAGFPGGQDDAWVVSIWDTNDPSVGGSIFLDNPTFQSGIANGNGAPDPVMPAQEYQVIHDLLQNQAIMSSNP